MGERKIPNPAVAVIADVIGSHYYNHTRLNTLFAESGAPGEPPEGNCVNKCEQWLKRCNADPSVDACEIAGKVLENFMELEHPASPWDSDSDDEHPGQKRVRDTLARYGLSYQTGGFLIGAGASPASKSLVDHLRARDLPNVEKEFERALATVESDPPSGVTAACAVLESLFKVYLEDNQIPIPAQQTLGPLFKSVRKHLGLDPSNVADEDLKRILSGLISVADGIGALRTHTGSAHGRGREGYRIAPRHARLAINSAHSLAVFVIETWSSRERAAG